MSNFATTSVRQVYNKIRRGNMNGAVVLWVESNVRPGMRNERTLISKIGNSKWAMLKKGIANREVRLKRYMNKKLASEILRFENRIKRNGTVFGSNQTFFNLRRRIFANKMQQVLGKNTVKAITNRIVLPPNKVIESMRIANNQRRNQQSKNMYNFRRTTRRTRPVFVSF